MSTYFRPDQSDAAHARQVDEHEAASQRAARTGKPIDVCEPAVCLRYRIDIWRRRQAVPSNFRATNSEVI